MNKLFALSFIFLLLAAPVHATEVIVKVNDVEALAGDTATIELEIFNDEPFVGFNTDIRLPEGFSYVEGSAKLYRDHDFLFRIASIGDNVVRMVSLSDKNNAFDGFDGVIVSFDVATPLLDGTFELSPENVIVGNAEAEDILTGIASGAITLELVETGITEAAESVAIIFPNPASTVLNIVSAGTTIEEIRAFDMLGQVIYSANVQGNHHEISVTGFRDGIYFIQVSTARGVQTHRVFISR